MNVSSFLTEAAAKWPGVPAVISPVGELSFAELRREAHALSRSLTNAGLGPGIGLGLVARNSPEFLIGLFAGLESGAVVMPISHNLKEQELTRVIDLVPVGALLHDSSLRHDIRGVTRSVHGRFTLELRSKAALHGSPEYHYRIASGVPDAAVVRFTSGTTGASKGVVLSHASVAERSAAAIKGLGLSAGERVTWVLPMAYHFVVSILTYVRYGVTLVLPADALPSAIIDSVDQYGSSMLYASPLIIQMLAADTSGRALPDSMRVVSTSSGLSPAHAEAFFNRYGKRVAQVYGLIEVGLPIGNFASDALDYSVGRAMPDYEVAILDTSGAKVSPGTPGRLAVRGAGMFDAYLAPYRPRSEVLVSGWFLTGDLAVEGPDGTITVCGREKSVINTAGNKVFPEEVEGVLNSYPGVRSARAFGAPHPLTGEVVHAEIVPAHATGLDLDALRRYCYERLSPYKVPKEIAVVTTLPLTDSGKVVRAA